MTDHPLGIDFPDWMLSGPIDAAFIARLADFLLQTGMELGVSSMHLTPERKRRDCALWIDGRKWPWMRIPAAAYEPLLAHYRTMVGIPVDRIQRPRLGSAYVTYKGREFNIRIIMLPILHGTKMVLRILAPDMARDRTALGLGEEEGEELDRLAALPRGLLLIAGPNGQGRATTAAALLNRIDDTIATFESVETYTFEGAIQTCYAHRLYCAKEKMVQASIDQGARVIFLDSINHPETAKVALDAAQRITVISTNSTFYVSDSPVLDALDTIGRLRMLGMEPARIAQSVSGICAQRLIPRICSHCAVDDVRLASDLHAFGYRADDPAQLVTLRRGAGCAECRKSGIRGSIGVFEVLTFDDTLATMLVNGATEAELREVSYATGRRGMREDALRKILAGIITLEDAEQALRRVPCIPRTS